MHTVAETPTFTRQASKLFTDDEKRELIDLLATDPLAGDVIPGTGGVRNTPLRRCRHWQAWGRPRCLLLDDVVPVYALLAYAKSARTDLTRVERRTVARLAAAIRTETRRSEP